MKNLLFTTIIFLLFQNIAKAEPTNLGTLDDFPRKHENTITYESLSKKALKCMFDKAFLDIDVKLQSGVSTRKNGFTQGQDTFAGLVLSVPLYSGKELSRERNRTVTNKKGVVADVKILIEGVEKVLHGRRMLEVYKILEERSRRRVLSGVMPLIEQVAHMEKISKLSRELIVDESDILGSRTMLLAKCKEGKDKKDLKNYLDRLEEMDIR